jgi:hypothetical protein
VLGGVGLLAFAVTGEAAFRRGSPWLGLALASAVWLAASLALYGLLAVLRPDLCDKDKDKDPDSD